MLDDTTRPISRVQEGMRVLDAAGDDVGKVEIVQMADPGTVTVNQDERPKTLMGAAAEAFGADREPDVPEPLRSRLLVSGYLKIDGPGLLDRDRYVSSDDVRDVRDDRVHLSVRKEQLARED
jgi:hypothetical protein